MFGGISGSADNIGPDVVIYEFDPCTHVKANDKALGPALARVEGSSRGATDETTGGLSVEWGEAGEVCTL